MFRMPSSVNSSFPIHSNVLTIVVLDQKILITHQFNWEINILLYLSWNQFKPTATWILFFMPIVGLKAQTLDKHRYTENLTSKLKKLSSFYNADDWMVSQKQRRQSTKAQQPLSQLFLNFHRPLMLVSLLKLAIFRSMIKQSIKDLMFVKVHRGRLTVVGTTNRSTACTEFHKLLKILLKRYRAYLFVWTHARSMTWHDR